MGLRSDGLGMIGGGAQLSSRDFTGPYPRRIVLIDGGSSSDHRQAKRSREHFVHSGRVSSHFTFLLRQISQPVTQQSISNGLKQDAVGGVPFLDLFGLEFMVLLATKFKDTT